MTQTKQDSDKRRVIINLSWQAGASVNHFTDNNIYMGTAFKLSYPSIDTFTDRLRSLGGGALMLKIEVSRVFYQLKVNPADFPLLCLYWNDAFYVDEAYAFSHCLSGLGGQFN